MKRSNISGIYQIRNTVNGKIYIGSSSSIHRRWSEHKRYLRLGKHSNPRLQLSWNKHGEKLFEFSIVHECPVESLQYQEQYFIFALRPQYNIAEIVGMPNTPKAGTPESFARSKKNVESRANSEWCNSQEFHNIMSSIMYDRWKDKAYTDSRSSETTELWNNNEYRLKQKASHRKINEQDRETIRGLVSNGQRRLDVANQYGVHVRTISRIVLGLH